jgi:hypothetical protein
MLYCAPALGCGDLGSSAVPRFRPAGVVGFAAKDHGHGRQ